MTARPRRCPLPAVVALVSLVAPTAVLVPALVLAVVVTSLYDDHPLAIYGTVDRLLIDPLAIHALAVYRRRVDRRVDGTADFDVRPHVGPDHSNADSRLRTRWHGGKCQRASDPERPTNQASHLCLLLPGSPGEWMPSSGAAGVPEIQSAHLTGLSPECTPRLDLIRGR